MESHYVWKGKVEKSKETVVLFKVLAGKVGHLEREIIKFHPYDVPFIGVIDIESVNAGYFNYAIQQQT
ncbi:MAG: hypothetical protein K0R29_1540 [Pseudobdellovibrio sp.]|nr:hypothetical protein [Pseudobdellovibrio sp.]